MDAVMVAYEDSRKLAIEGIESALTAHENQDFFLIGDELELLEIQIDKQEIPEGSLLLIAYEFLTGWSDSAAHDWYDWEPMKKDDWPRLAYVILKDLRANREVTDPELISEFCFIGKPKESIVSKVLGLFRAKKA